MSIYIMDPETQREPGLRKLGPHRAAAQKTRVVSMPPTLACNSTQASVYSQPSRFSGSGSPPIIDFTDWADNFRGQRFGFSIPNDLTPETRRTGPHSILPRSAKSSPHEWRIEYPVLLSALRPLVDSQGKGLEDVLRVEGVENLHQQDQDCLFKRFQMENSKDGNLAPRIDGVIGKPLSDVFLHASLSLSIAGTQHFVPTIVVKCVEELYRTGLYQPQLFRRTPNFGRVEELVEVYDHRDLPGAIRIARQRPNQTSQYALLPHDVFGSQTSLHMETTENICALLRTFLQYLPEPILSPCLFEAIWNFCGVRQEAFQSGFHLPLSHGAMVMNRLGGAMSSEELVRIYIAQISIHLLPTPNFSLMVYLLSFFSQVVMVHEQNGLAVDDVASMFGVIVFGGATERIVSWTDSKPRPRGEIMMRWFLRRWRQIYHGLFPYDDEGRQSSSGVSSLSPVNEEGDPSLAMDRRSSGYFSLLDPPTVSAHDILAPVPDEAEEAYSPRILDVVNTAAPQGATPSIPEHIAADASTLPLNPPFQQTTRAKTAQLSDRWTSGTSELTTNYLEELWPHLTSDLRMKLNERMLDTMLEPLLISSTPKLTRQRSHSAPSRLKPAAGLKTISQKEAASQREPSLANQRGLKLESWIQENKQLLQETLAENQRIKRDKAMLEVHIKALEDEIEFRDAKHKESEERVKKGMKETVEGVVRERDEARGIVSEIQRISGRVNGGLADGGGFERN